MRPAHLREGCVLGGKDTVFLLKCQIYVHFSEFRVEGMEQVGAFWGLLVAIGGE